MKRLLLLLIALSSSLQAQIEKFNGYKSVAVLALQYPNGNVDPFGLEKITKTYLSERGFNVLSANISDGQALVNGKILEDKDLCGILFLEVRYANNSYTKINISAMNCLSEIIFNKTGDSFLSDKKGIRKIFNFSKDFKYSYDESLALQAPKGQMIMNTDEFDINDEGSVRKYLDSQRLESIEGIWNYASNDNSEYKLLILKDDYLFKAYILESNNDYIWSPGDLKAVFEPAAVNTIMTLKWTMGDKVTKIKSISTVESGVIKFNLGDEDDETLLYKVYPQLQSATTPMQQPTGEWTSSGSGILISSTGHIATNYHVIENANKIEVEFSENGEYKSYNAEVVLSDKVNDLSLLKILDLKFNQIEEPPYNFQLRNVDVGTSVYAFGYPMALSLMGKELKVTDGIISAKSGFQGDITTYQISAPIQAGNSGGPLFDSKGNLIGINSSGVRKDVAENVGYSIKSSYLRNLLDALPYTLDLPRNTSLENLSLPEQIKALSKYIVLIKVK